MTEQEEFYQEVLARSQQMNSKPLKKGAGCVYCEHIFDCPGKPPEVKLCVNFKERRKAK